MYPDTQDALIEHNVIDGNGYENRGNVTFSGEEAGGEYDRDYASDNNLLRNNIVTNSRARYNIDSYYPTIQPGGNLVTGNCVWNAPWGNTTSEGGFAYVDNLDRDPLFVDRAAKDFRRAAKEAHVPAWARSSRSSTSARPAATTAKRRASSGRPTTRPGMFQASTRAASRSGSSRRSTPRAWPSYRSRPRARAALP